MACRVFGTKPLSEAMLKYTNFNWKEYIRKYRLYTLQWRHNGLDCVSNHQPRDCLLNRLFRRRSKKTSKLSVTGLCVGNSPVTGEFPAQRASDAENVSMWWHHHERRPLRLVSGLNLWKLSMLIPGPQFTEQWEFPKFRSCDLWISNRPIAMKFVRHGKH